MTTPDQAKPSHPRTRWAAIGAAVAVTLGAAGIGSYDFARADIESGDRPVFVSITPCRLLDTRPGPPNVGPQAGPMTADQTLTVTAHGENGQCVGDAAIPTDAVALSLNVTALNQTERTFLTIWDDGPDPGTSNLNPEPGQPPTPNAVNTPLSSAGTFNVRNNAGEVNVIADVVGYYANHNHDDRYYTEPEVDAAIDAAVQSAVDGLDPVAAAYPDRLFVPATSFTRSATADNLSINSGRLEFDAGPNRCFVTGIPAPPSARNLLSVDVLYEKRGTDADIIVDMHRPRTVVGESARAQLIASGSTTLTAAPIAERGDLEAFAVPVPQPAAMNPNETYTVLVCSGDNLEVAGLAVNSESAP